MNVCYLSSDPRIHSEALTGAGSHIRKDIKAFETSGLKVVPLVTGDIMDITDTIDKYLDEKEVEPTQWTGTLPKKCDICGASLKDGWVDGATKKGPWANMCKKCFKKFGKGLGLGKGQQYNGKGLKIAG